MCKPNSHISKSWIVAAAVKWLLTTGTVFMSVPHNSGGCKTNSGIWCIINDSWYTLLFWQHMDCSTMHSLWAVHLPTLKPPDTTTKLTQLTVPHFSYTTMWLNFQSSSLDCPMQADHAQFLFFIWGRGSRAVDSPLSSMEGLDRQTKQGPQRIGGWLQLR